MSSIYLYMPAAAPLVVLARRAHRERMLRLSMNAVPDAGIDLRRGRPGGSLGVVPKPDRLWRPKVKVPPKAEPEPLVKVAPLRPDLRLRPPPPFSSAAFPYAFIRAIQTAAVLHFRSQDSCINLACVTSGRKTGPIVRLRHVAMYLCRKLTKCSTPEIGRRFGGRHHTTALHGALKIEAELPWNEVLLADLSAILSLLRDRGYPVDEIIQAPEVAA